MWKQRISGLGCCLFAAVQPGTLYASGELIDKTESSEEEVILVDTQVYARFSPESDRKIPFTINHFAAEDLAERQIPDMQSLLWQTPGVALDTDGQNPDFSIKIRGTGAINQVSNDDTSVVTMLNGVPVPQGNLTSRLLDIEQVDILKGPQGTLFGRNSEAGVVNIITKKPTDTFEGHISGEWGTYGHSLGQMVVNTPFSDTVSSRIAMQYDEKNAGLRNLQDGNKPLSQPRNLTGRLSLAWQPDDRNDLYLTFDHNRQRHNAAGMTLLDGAAKISYPRGTMKDEGDDATLTLHAQHRWERLQLTSVTGAGRYNHSSAGPMIDARISQRLYDAEYDSWRMFSNNQKQYFQELRLGSGQESPVFWVAGTNYIRSERLHKYDGGWNQAPGWDEDPMNATINRRFINDSAALFGETTFPVTDKTEFTGGLRYTTEKTGYRARWKSHSASLAWRDDQTLHESYFTGRAGVNYALSNNWNLYALYSRGHKAGGFSNWDTSIASGEHSTPYKQASVNSYEIGAKSAVPSLNLEFKQALFINKTHNDHYFALKDPSKSFATVTENVDSKSQGAEVSATWRYSPDLELKMGVDYTQATITALPENSQSGGKKGNRIPDVPLWGISLAADYSHPLQVRDLPVVFNSSLAYRYSSSRQADIGNNFELAEMHLLNARAGLKTRYGDVYLWSTNILNNRSPVYGFYYPSIPVEYGGTGKDAQVGSIRDGRVTGIGYRYYF